MVGGPTTGVGSEATEEELLDGAVWQPQLAGAEISAGEERMPERLLTRDDACVKAMADSSARRTGRA